MIGKFFAALREFFHRLLGLGSAPPLCDSCRFDYGDVCKRRERPNARVCPDYRRR